MGGSHDICEDLILLAFIAFAILSAAAWSYMFLRRDRFEPEPRWLLFRLFIGGAVAAVAAGAANGLAFELGVSEGAIVILVAPPVEETLKIVAVFILAYGSRHFTQLVDGAVYGVSLGLGFAVVENISYAVEFGASTLAARSLFIPVGHALFTGVSGLYLARMKFDGRRDLAVLGLGIAVLLHAMWNAPTALSLILASDWFLTLGFIVLALEIAVLVRFLKRMSSPEAQALRRLVQVGHLDEPVSS